MMDRLNEIDWEGLKHPEIKILIQNAASQDDKIQGDALTRLKDAIAPWEILDGYAAGDMFERITTSPLPEIVTPFIIDLLADKEIKHKDFMLEILYDVARYKLVDRSFVPESDRNRYENWAKKLFSIVEADIDLYKSLILDTSDIVQRGARDLVNLLLEYKDDVQDS
jgi:hypothetical protein